MARSPSSGLGNRFILAISLLEDPLFSCPAQLFQTLFAARFGIDSYNWFGPGEPIANPRAILENQLQPVFAHHFADVVSAELPRIGPQLLSELGFHLRRQAEVLTLRIIGTNLVTQGLQLISKRLAALRHHLAAQQPGKYSIFFGNVMADREPRAFFAADGDLILHN